MTLHSDKESKPVVKYGLWSFARRYLRWLSLNRSPRPFAGLDLHPEEASRLSGAYTFCLILILFMGALLLTELYIGNLRTLLSIGGLLLLCIASCIYISVTNKITAPILLMSGYLFVMYGYFLWVGITDNNSILYYFWVIPVMVICLNTRLGAVLSLIFIVMLIVLFLPPVYEHMAVELSPGYRLRFILTMACVYIVSAVAEYYLHYMFKSIFNINRQLEQYSLTDALTGQGNRRNFINQFQRLHAMQLRSGEAFSIVMADLDHFKRVNDTHGHLRGDEVLCFVADTLAQSLRQQDSLYRWGGEEFIILLPGTSIQQGEIVAQRMRQAIAETSFNRGSLSINLTASFGVYTVSTAQPMHEHIRNTDILLYQAKASGRNRVISAINAPEPLV